MIDPGGYVKDTHSGYNAVRKLLLSQDTPHWLLRALDEAMQEDAFDAMNHAAQLYNALKIRAMGSIGHV